MELLSLPDELLLHIAKTVAHGCLPESFGEILKLRCICRKLDGIIGLALVSLARHDVNVPFSTVTIRPIELRISCLLSISKNEYFRRLVKVICLRLKPLDFVKLAKAEWLRLYGRHFLDAMMTYSMKSNVLFETWHGPQMVMEDSVAHQFPVNSIDAFSRYKAYCVNLEAQRSIFRHETLIGNLKKALQLMPNLKELSSHELTTLCDLGCQNEEERYEGQMFQILPLRSRATHDHYQLLKAFLKPLADCRSISNLSFKGFDACAIGNDYIFRNLPSFAQHLQSLKITLNVSSFYSDCNNGVAKPVRNWSRFLETFQNVRSLDLAHVPDCHDDLFYTYFKDVLDKLRFPRLTTFRLANIQLDPYILQRFLISHRMSLENLELDPLPFFAEERVEASKSLLDALRDELNLHRARIVVHQYQLGDMTDDMITAMAKYLADDKYRTACAICDCNTEETKSHRDIGDYIIKRPVTQPDDATVATSTSSHNSSD